jgi:predicted  nucleic acid-binding Zn-ribbon protein
MAITKQLFQLQELDTEIEQEEEELSQKNGRLGNRQVLDDAQKDLNSRQQQFDELKHQHRDAEAEVDDHLNKIADIEGQLYSGKITNPKELSGLQHELNTMKTKSDELENNALEIIDRVEAAEKSVAEAIDNYQKLEESWQREQQQLSTDIENLNTSLADLREKRRQLSEQVDASALNLYERIRKQKKLAVVKVEQGICRACRITLSASAQQRARGGQPVTCGSCGRILYIS